jgi:ABC-type nitrate/sulfonate/bicarbonate transport system ATPase subunit
MPAKGVGRFVAVASPPRTAALTADRLERRFGSLTAITSFSLRVEPGEVVAILGPSGCGKSTVLEILAGLQQPDAGTVLGGGESCALMPQSDLLLPWRDTLANAGLSLECAGYSKSEARRMAEPLAQRFGLEGFERAYPRALSGGMRQRVAFLRTLLAGRPALLLDEPFGALDSITRASMQEWLAGALAEEPRTLVLVTHDVEEALYLADRVAVMSPRPGRIVAEIEVPFERPRRRRATVTSQAFGELREQAMEALGQ